MKRLIFMTRGNDMTEDDIANAISFENILKQFKFSSLGIKGLWQSEELESDCEVQYLINELNVFCEHILECHYVWYFVVDANFFQLAKIGCESFE